MLFYLKRFFISIINALGIGKKSTNERKYGMTVSFYYIFLVNIKKVKCTSTVMEVFKIEILQKNFTTPGTNRDYSEREKYLIL